MVKSQILGEARKKTWTCEGCFATMSTRFKGKEDFQSDLLKFSSTWKEKRCYSILWSPNLEEEREKENVTLYTAVLLKFWIWKNWGRKRMKSMFLFTLVSTFLPAISALRCYTDVEATKVGNTNSSKFLKS